MNTSSLKSRVAKGAIWTLLEKLSTQVVGFVMGMILARILTPEAYGTVALTTIFFVVTRVLVDGGFGTALIQKKDADDLDFNSVFYLNLALSVVAYIILYLVAPWIANFYKSPELTAIVRVSALNILFCAIDAIQGAELSKKMLFHLSFKISLITCLASAICGITLAFLGFGVWALVWSSLATGLVGVVSRWFIIAWRPKPMFSLSRLKPLFSYGWKLAAMTVINTFFANINSLLIGKFYLKSDVAFVNKGRSLPSLAMNEIDGTIGRVSFPALVLLQGDTVRLREAMRRMMRCSTFFVFPMMLGIAICSHSWIRLLYGEKWTPAVPYMALSCFTFALWPFHTINLKGLFALGRSDILLKLEIIKKTVALIVIVSCFRLGVFTWMAVSAFVIGPFALFVNAWPNKKLLNYTIGMQLRDVMPTALVCCAQGAVMIGIGLVANLTADYFGVVKSGAGYLTFLAGKLAIQGILGIAVFFGLAYAFKLNPMGEYAHMAAVALRSRFPKISQKLDRRFPS